MLTSLKAIDCDGNQLDALGVCGGDCTADDDADGICDDVDDCVGALDACGVCNGAGDIYECGVLTSLKATAIATETKKTLWAFAAVIARLTTMRMASATMLMTAWVRSTRAACATAQGHLRVRMF